MFIECRKYTPNINLRELVRWTGAALAASLAVGCGASAETADSLTELGSLSLAHEEETCKTAPATSTFSDEGRLVTGANYTTLGCSDAVVVDVAPFEFDGTFTVRDVGGPLPTTQAQCESVELFLEAYAQYPLDNGDIESVEFDSESRRAVFVPPNRCVLPVNVSIVASALVAGMSNDEKELTTNLRAVAKSGLFQTFGNTRAIEVSYTPR